MAPQSTSACIRWAFAFALIGLVAAAGCAERVEDPKIRVHPAAWSEPDSTDFHGQYVRGRTYESCAGCHGEDYEGADAAPSCYACHNGPSGHPEMWNEPAQHGEEVVTNGADQCRDCHGEDYRGGWSGVSC